jgi:phage tail-like protein
MSLPGFETGVGWSFGLEVDGVEMREIEQVDGLSFSLRAVVAGRAADDGPAPDGRRLERGGEIAFTRGVGTEAGWHAWVNRVFERDRWAARKGGSVTIYDYSGTPVQSFRFLNGWAKSITYATARCGEASVLTETLTIAHDGIEPA